MIYSLWVRRPAKYHVSQVSETVRQIGKKDLHSANSCKLNSRIELIGGTLPETAPLTVSTARPIIPLLAAT